MATAKERIEEEVTCPVCMDRFSVSGDHVPRILPCHHTICELCLNGISRAEEHHLVFSLKCPTCRNEALIPNGDVTNFEVDFRVNRLIEVLARLQQQELPSGESIRKKAARLRPEVNKSANALRSFLRQLELATRQNNVNSLVRKQKVADNVKLCMALLKQREKEMLEEIESRRVENEQALTLQQEEAELELGNIESVLALERSCFTHSEVEEAARTAEVEVLPLMEVYSARYMNIAEPLVPETIPSFSSELLNIRTSLTRVRDLEDEWSRSDSECSLDDSGISESPSPTTEPSLIQQSEIELVFPEEPTSLQSRQITTSSNQSTITSFNSSPESDEHNSNPVRRPQHNSLRHFSSTWGTRGTGPSQLDTPTGLCVLQQGQIAVADAGNCKVCIFNSDGSYLRHFGRKGRSPGQLNCPNAVASRNGLLFVADTYNHRISVHREDGTFLSYFGSRGSSRGEFDRPIGITTTDSGEVIVADTWNHRLQVFDTEGNFVRVIGKRGSGPGEFQCPCGVAQNSQGQLYVCDLDNKRVQVLDSQGRYLRQFGRVGSHLGAMHAPRAIAIDSNDYVYVTEYEKHYFQVFDSRDNFVSRYGSHGSGVGEFDKPCGVAVDPSCRVIVSDSFNHRLHMF